MSPSSSACGTSAATESITTRVDRAALHQDLRDVERLLAVVGLADQKLLRVHSEVLGVVHIERVLGVDERRDATRCLALRDGVERERGLAARLRAVDLDDAALRIAAAAERLVERGAASGDARDALRFAVAEAHHRALAELLFDALEQGVDGLEWLFHL